MGGKPVLRNEVILGVILLLLIPPPLLLLWAPVGIAITIRANDFSRRMYFPFIPLFMGLGILAVFLVISLIIILIAMLIWRSGGIAVSFKENTYRSLVDKKAEFTSRLLSELGKRGYPAKELDENTLIYEDFFNRAYLYISSEGDELRFGFRLELKNICLLSIVLLTLIGLIPIAIILCIIWFIKYNALKEALTLAGEATAKALSS